MQGSEEMQLGEGQTPEHGAFGILALIKGSGSLETLLCSNIYCNEYSHRTYGAA